MKPEGNTDSDPKSKQSSDRGKSQLPGQNPRQNDAVDHDENNDQNRVNKFERSKPTK
jgi:hypothetical protein